MTIEISKLLEKKSTSHYFMATKTNQRPQLCDAHKDVCMFCKKEQKGLHSNSNYAPVCTDCYKSYSTTKCAICGKKMNSTGATTHYCSHCTDAKLRKNCCLCGKAFK